MVVGSPAEDGEVTKKNSDSRGDLMATKNSKDEGGVAKVQYDH